jgi:hypothetical protein
MLAQVENRSFPSYCRSCVLSPKAHIRKRIIRQDERPEAFGGTRRFRCEIPGGMTRCVSPEGSACIFPGGKMRCGVPGGMPRCESPKRDAVHFPRREDAVAYAPEGTPQCVSPKRDAVRFPGGKRGAFSPEGRCGCVCPRRDSAVRISEERRGAIPRREARVHFPGGRCVRNLRGEVAVGARRCPTGFRRGPVSVREHSVAGFLFAAWGAEALRAQ